MTKKEAVKEISRGLNRQLDEAEYSVGMIQLEEEIIDGKFVVGISIAITKEDGKPK